MEHKCSTRLCAPALGMGIGIVSGLVMMLFAWASWIWGYGAAMVTQYSALYIGYAPTLGGGLIGGLWGLIEGFIMGLIIGWIYNLCARCCGCGCGCSKCCGTCGDKPEVK